MEDYHPKVAEFRMLLKDQLEIRLTSREREGHYEDLLMVTILDPRFKNMVSSSSFLLQLRCLL